MHENEGSGVDRRVVKLQEVSRKLENGPSPRMLCCNLTERAEMFKELTIRSEFYCVYSQCELTPGDYNCFKNYVGKKKNYLHFSMFKTS